MNAKAVTKLNTKVSPVNMEERKNLGIKSGDTIRVWQKIQDKGKTRVQAFEGIVLAKKHGNEAGATFTVRRVLDGVGVEKIFPLYSPIIDKIEITKRAKVRRAKLYYIRDKASKEIKKQMRKAKMVDISTLSGIDEKRKEDEKNKKDLAEEENKKILAEKENQSTQEETKKEE